MTPIHARKRHALCTPDQRADEVQAFVDDFNRRFPVGTRVWYWSVLPFGPVKEVTIREPAFLSCSGVPVCFVAGVSGYVSAFHITEIDESRRAQVQFVQAK